MNERDKIRIARQEWLSWSEFCESLKHAGLLKPGDEKASVNDTSTPVRAILSGGWKALRCEVGFEDVRNRLAIITNSPEVLAAFDQWVVDARASIKMRSEGT